LPLKTNEINNKTQELVLLKRKKTSPTPPYQPKGLGEKQITNTMREKMATKIRPVVSGLLSSTVG
jgi:hypothetical protein